MDDIRLTTLVPVGGCGRKLGARDLVQALAPVAPFAHDWVDPDVGPMEDAALLRPGGANGSAGLVLTVDFFTPIVDEAEAYGAIAAANAMSDVYAMGGDPQVALAVCGFPEDALPLEIVTRIFRGGRDKAAEAGCAIVGGHTIVDPELKYGLCVLGNVDPERRLTQTRARVGDRLVLTKPVGFGIAAQGMKAERLSADEVASVIELMSMLNRDAKDAALAAGAEAATDVTGFGVLGHLHHLLGGSGVAARIDPAAVPVLPFSRALAEEGVAPGGCKKNRAYVEPHVTWDDGLDEVERVLLTDPQTSGGLLIAVAPEGCDRLVEELAARGAPAHAVIGEVVSGEAGMIHVGG